MKSNYTNYTVVGELTYGDGVYGGFTGTDFLVLPQGLKNKSYTYITKFTTGSDVNTMQYVVHAEKFFSIEISGGDIKCWSWDSGTGGDKTLFAASTNTTYWVKSTFNGNTRTYWHSTDGTTWTQDLEFSDNGTEEGPNKWEFRIGMESWDAIDPFQGTVDMNEFKIYEGNNLVWEPSTAVKDNADVVGSLNIIGGFVSGFSTSNYLTLPETFPSSTANSWEMVFKIKHESFSGGQRVCGALNNTSLSQIVIGIDNNKLITWISSNGTNWNIASGNTGSTTLTNGVTYWVKARFTGSQYIISLSTDGSSYSDQITVSSSTKMNQNNSKFLLGCAELTNYLHGGLFLKDSYININGKHWWSGSSYKSEVGSVNVSKGYYTDGVNEILMPDQRFSLRSVKDGQIIGNRNNTFAASTSGVTSLHIAGNDTTEQALQGTYDVSANVNQPIYLSHGENYAISSERDMSTFPSLKAKNLTANVTNVGGVSIYSDGTAGGFYTSRYLQVPVLINPGKAPWEFCMRMQIPGASGYAYGSSTNYYQTFGGEFDSSHRLGWGLSSNGSSWNIAWLWSTAKTENSWVYFKFIFTGSQYRLETSTDGVTWALDASTNNANAIYQSSSSIMYIGTMGNKGSYFAGALDLTKCYYKVNGVELWRGATVDSRAVISEGVAYKNYETFWYPKEADVSLTALGGSNLKDVNPIYATNKPGEDLSSLSLDTTVYPGDSAYIPAERAYLVHSSHDKILGVQKEPNSVSVSSSNTCYTAVGSPSMGTYGTVGNFSISNYLKIPTFDPAGQIWEVNMKVNTSADVTTNQKIFNSSCRAGQSGRFGIIAYVISSHFRFTIADTEGSWLFDTTGTYTVLANTMYWLRMGWTGTEYYFEYSTDGVNYTRDITETYSIPLWSPLRTTQIGVYSTTSGMIQPWLGTMYMADCYATVNGTEVWRGYKNGNLKLNCEAVGNPAFNPGGEAYNFSSTWYYKLQPGLDFASADSWEIHAKVRITNSGKYQFWFQNPVAFGFDNSNRVHVWGTPSDFYSTLTFTELNVWYYIKLVFDGSSYKIYWRASDNPSRQWNLIATLNSSTKISNTTANYIGINPGNTSEYFYGTIDLSELYVIMDGVEVWRAATTTFPDSGYRTIGSPTISNYIVSNFSASNYLIPVMNYMAMADKGPWELGVKIKFTDLTGTQVIWGGAPGNYVTDLYLNSSNHLAVNLASSSDSWGIASGNSGTLTVAANTWYWIKFGWTGSVYYVDYSTDGTNYTRDITVNSTTPTFDSWLPLYLGYGYNSSMYVRGQIDLLETYMKSEGTEVWRGALYSGYGFVNPTAGWTGLGGITYELPWKGFEAEKLPYNYSVDPEYNYNSDLKGFLTVDYVNNEPVLRGLNTTSDCVGSTDAAYLGYSYNVNATEGKAIQNLTKTGTLCKAFSIPAIAGKNFVFIRSYELEDGKTYVAGTIKEKYSELMRTPFRELDASTDDYTYHVGEMDYLTDSEDNVYDEVGYVYVEW